MKLAVIMDKVVQANDSKQMRERLWGFLISGVVFVPHQTGRT